MERWLNDNVPVAGETFRTFVKDLYQRNKLCRGELELGGRRVDLRRIACPVLLLTARNDHLVPPRSTEGIRPHLGSANLASDAASDPCAPRVESMTIDAGHVGLVVGGKAQATLWPAAARWLARHSGAPPARSPAALEQGSSSPCSE
jgi:polyhydroxyalkanoate synthase subunit PhaC